MPAEHKMGGEREKEMRFEVAHQQACKLKFRLGELTSCLCSAAASAVCFEGRVAGLDAAETGNELSQPT